MIALVERAYEALLAESPEVERLHTYPDSILIRCVTLPSAIPEGAAEIIDDATVSVHGRPVNIQGDRFDPGETPRALVRFIGPIASEWVDELRARGIRIHFWCPRYGACVQFPASVREENRSPQDWLRAFPFLAGVMPYDQAQCLRGTPRPSERVRWASGLPSDLVDVVCFSREDRARVATELAERQIPVVASSSSKLRVEFRGDPAELRRIAGVKLVDPARAPLALATGTLPSVLGLASAAGGWDKRFTGRGQVIAVADTGLDRGTADETLHPDFRGRVRSIESWPINPSWSSFVRQPGHDDGAADRNSGHGTYVAGLAAGDGTRSGGTHRGVAPEATLVFQAIEQYTEVRRELEARLASGYYLNGRPLDLRQLFARAREEGARIHINAWGDPAQGAYTDDCFEADFFLHQNPDAVILFAAGNDGRDEDGDRAIDPRSLYAPASAKNVIAIGATEGGDVGVGHRGTYADFDRSGRRFRNPQDRIQPVSGAPTRMALFSSTGPTADGRIKPDVCAPGTNLVAPRSSACNARGWGLASPLPHYMYDGGTSAATGIAGGWIALLRQAWTEFRNGRAPSGAALKASMVLGARDVQERSEDAPEAPEVAGFGRLCFERSIPAPPAREILLLDSGDRAAAAIQTGEQRTYPFHVHTTAPLCAVLVWYDPPGERLINDLDLILIDPQQRRIFGNHFADPTGRPDRHNCVERIDLAALAPGRYELRVVGANVPLGPQAFALAICFDALRVDIELPGQASREPSDVLVSAVRGIGPTYAKRLAGHGVTRLFSLQSLSGREIGEMTGLRGARLARVHDRLQRIFEITAVPLAASIPTTLTLAEIRSAAVPDGVEPAAWDEARKRLAPLIEAFDREELDRLALDRLFG